jgi:hypothetical protein
LNVEKNKPLNTFHDLNGHISETIDDPLHSSADALEISKEKTIKDVYLLTDAELEQKLKF